MQLSFTEDQISIRDTAQRFFSEQAPVSLARKLRDDRSVSAYDAGVWQQQVELGFSAIAIGEQWGGLGMGYQTLGAVVLESARNLANSPLCSNSYAAALIEVAGSETQRGYYLPRLADGRITMTVAFEEGHHHAPQYIKSRATLDKNSWRLSGVKTQVLNASTVDSVVVLATTTCGLSLFIVPAQQLQRQARNMIDHRDNSSLVLEGVTLDQSCLLGDVGTAEKALQHMLNIARALVSAELLGASLELQQRTNDYIKERKQFGVAIGSFQALQHRCAQLYAEMELTRSTVRAAFAAIDEGSEKAARFACLAKARANETSVLACKEAIQMHGGMGVSDELDIGLFVKRCKMAEHSFGSSRQMRDLYAQYDAY